MRSTPVHRRFNLQLSFALLVIALFVTAGLFGSLNAPYDPTEQNLAETLKPPLWHAEGSRAHLLGTSSLGQDILSGLLAGARVSLLVALCAVGLSGLFGVAVGLVSGYLGGWVDAVLMRLADIQISIPFILLAIALIGALGPSLSNVILVIAITNWVTYAKLVRTETARLKERDFVRFARVCGIPWYQIFLRHLLPNVMNSIVVLVTLDIGKVIIFESGLSFLGLGVQPPTPSWGGMLADGRKYINIAYWTSLLPGIAIFLVVLCVNFAGNWLRVRTDPKAAP
ncbi:MAG: ABC transporter permease [Betaproteobacteria bacterium]